MRAGAMGGLFRISPLLARWCPTACRWFPRQLKQGFPPHTTRPESATNIPWCRVNMHLVRFDDKFHCGPRLVLPPIAIHLLSALVTGRAYGRGWG
jgi:hypothetical protein